MARSSMSVTTFLLALTVVIKAQDDAGLYEELNAALHHYDTLHSDHINHSYTSSTSFPRHRHVQFRVLGRHFHLSLVPNSRLFSRDFGAHVVGEDGEPRAVHLNREEFYHGHIPGDELSSVTAHISESGVMTASIITSSEVYHIEPSRHYVRKPHPFHMVAYKWSHVKDRLRGNRMDYITGPTTFTDDNLESESILEKSSFHPNHIDVENGRNRLKRQTLPRLPGGIGGRACPMILVADFTVFDRFGSDERSVVVQLVQLMDSIDRIIYRPSNWVIDTAGRTVSNLGIEIRNVTVHSVSSDSSDITTYYNRDNPGADANDLLGDMRFGNWNGFCLAHLFTNRNFASGLLGLANIASPLAGQTGGVCSQSFRDFGFDPPRDVIYNTGLTTFNNNGEQMVMSELIRVTGHELGHNWGSHHDPPEDPNCGDRWLMNEFAQDGSEETHMDFSVCSRVAIGQVLVSKGTCFDDPGTCGNFEIDDGEQCDAGPEGDICCNRECILVEGAICSDLNQACCKNCSYASTNVTCRAVGSITVNCRAATKCNGMNATCPEEAPPAEDGTPCIGPSGGGVCQMNTGTGDSECVSVCTLSGLTPCTCDDPYECVVCCRDGSGQCSPTEVESTVDGNRTNTTLPLSNGAGCSNNMRVCIDGQCTDTTQDLIERIWSIIVNLDINALGVFLSENIVGFVLIFTIPVWCVCGCIVQCCVDPDGYIHQRVKGMGKAVLEDTDVDLWFKDRLERYYQRLEIKSESDERTPLLSRSEESADEKTGSEERLVDQPFPPGSPVDDSPAPKYTYIN